MLAIWCPDWPAVAAAAMADLPATRPVAVTLANRVTACTAAARALGVRRGMRRRESQARCPQLHIVAADVDRDARFFEPMIAAVDDLVPGAEILRPGLMALPVTGAARYFGSEQTAAERLADAVSVAGAECQVGIADQMSTAVYAARHAALVSPGGDAEFLAPLSIKEMATEPSLCHPQREDLVDLLWRMGIRTIGAFAELARSDVASRFDDDAVQAHRHARAEPQRSPSGHAVPAELGVELPCDPPIERVDAAAFAGRTLAVSLHEALASAGVACSRLAIHAVTVDGQELSRVWRCAEPLTEEATADRVRWQLDGWLARRRSLDGPVAMLRLEPVEVVAAEALQLTLWGAVGAEERQRARRALIRVQDLLGEESVQVGVVSGGRGPAERITLVPLGDELRPRADPDAPWPGRLPDPAPTVLLGEDGEPVELLDIDGAPVTVTGRGMFSGEPARVRRGNGRWELSWWAGPWPIDERWWEEQEPTPAPVSVAARAQVLLEDTGGGQALLLHFRRQRWYVEGVYE
ncbi:DNA polymerase IV [Mycobacteroides salmoniphilum]|uniref:DNA polymerase IV n=1 Tax=Mycobacteroides salmoniphilum TaxID=404941 RepID=A0A4R8S8K5_9MYCO|nr:DNA polymerase Y family protein [Mycobacteroides salmoniphilum]TDZ83197.1 DNA polymerase IV [Mycobacteroides salmoniphilum]